jgi:hypothetical protein
MFSEVACLSAMLCYTGNQFVLLAAAAMEDRQQQSRRGWMQGMRYASTLLLLRPSKGAWRHCAAFTKQAGDANIALDTLLLRCHLLCRLWWRHLALTT